MKKLGGALVSVLAVSLADAALPPAEIDVVFPRSNETYGIVSPFPLVFGCRNIQWLLSLDFSWTVTCAYETFSSVDTFYANELPKQHAEPLYLLNSTRLWYDRAPDYLKDKRGSLGAWSSDRDTCILAWTYSSARCQDLSNGIFEISTAPEVKGNLTFYLHPGGRLPHEAMSSYDGCPVAAVGFVDNSTNVCINEYKTSSDVNPCGLEVKAVASSIAAGLVAPSTTLTALPTRTTTASGSSQGTPTENASSGTTGSATGGNGSGKSSSGAALDSGALLAAILALLLV